MKVALIENLTYFLLAILSLKCYSILDNSNDDIQDLYGGSNDGDGYDSYDGYADPYHERISADVQQLHSLEDVEMFLSNEEFEPSVIGFFDSTFGTDDLYAFQEVAQQEGGNYRFAYCSEKEVLESMKYDRSAVLVYPPAKFISEKFERKRYRYPGETIANSASFTNFIHQKALPLVGELSQSSERRYQNVKLPILTVYTRIDHKRNPKGFQYVLNRLRKIAKDYKNLVIFTVANIEDYLSSLRSDLESPDIDEKKTYVSVQSNGFVYSHEGDFSFEKLAKFVQDFQEGKLVGKEKEPAEDNELDEEIQYENSDVVILNDQNWNEIVEESSRDILVEFYAPWCGHCKALYPEYSRLATSYKTDTGIIISATDATKTTLPSKYDVQGYPTLMFIPAHSKKPIVYDGERTVRGMMEFIDRHRSKEAEL